MVFKANKNLAKLPPYLFAELDRKKKSALARGVDIISFGIGDPDMSTPQYIIEAGKKALADGRNHHYPLGPGLTLFREAIARWYKRRFSVSIDPGSEVHVLIGSKEGIGHLPLGIIDPGDVVLVPEPGYPVYHTGTILAGGESYFLPLTEENDFIPDLDTVPAGIAQKAKILFLNYPNNPTAATASEKFFKKAVSFAQKNGIIIAHDAAYSELYYDQPPVSFLSVPGAREVGVEFHSLSKTYAMTGWRIGWVCGNKDVIRIVGKIKDNYDSGTFDAIQKAGIAALNGPQGCVGQMRALYRKRRDTLCAGLTEAGWQVRIPPATFYVWVRTPGNIPSAVCAGRMLDEAGVVCTPGSGFGPSGEGYVRFSLTVDGKRIHQALDRIAHIRWQDG